MTVVLRSYGVQDWAELIRVIDEVCGEGRWMSTTRFEPTPAWEHVLQRPHCDDYLLLLAADGSEVVGWCRVFPGANARQADASLGIGLLAPYRNRGIGNGLVQQGLLWAWSADLQRVILKTRLDNWRALNVFVRCGFEFLAETDGLWADMACWRPVLRPPQIMAPAVQECLYPTSPAGDFA